MHAGSMLRLAWKSLRGARVWMPAALFAVAAICGCVAFGIDKQVRAEQALPCELSMSVSSGAISDATLEQARQIPSVLGVTAILEFPTTVASGAYSAQLTLTGIDSDYLSGAFSGGGVFPDNSAMPYIVLNPAACKQFRQTSDDAQVDVPDNSTAEAPSIDWLKAGFAVATGEQQVVSKVCGILAEQTKDEQPIIYASLSSVKALLRAAGQVATVRTAKVRVVNIGQANAVSRALSALGLQAADNNAAQQSRWDGLYGQMRYLLALAVLALLCAVALLRQGARLAALRDASAWSVLEGMGANPNTQRQIAFIQGLMVALVGIAVGIIVALALPSFLPDNMAESVFALGAAAWSAH